MTVSANPEQCLPNKKNTTIPCRCSGPSTSARSHHSTKRAHTGACAPGHGSSPPSPLSTTTAAHPYKPTRPSDCSHLGAAFLPAGTLAEFSRSAHTNLPHPLCCTRCAQRPRVDAVPTSSPLSHPPHPPLASLPPFCRSPAALSLRAERGDDIAFFLPYFRHFVSFYGPFGPDDMECGNMWLDSSSPPQTGYLFIFIFFILFLVFSHPTHTPRHA